MSNLFVFHLQPQNISMCWRSLWLKKNDDYFSHIRIILQYSIYIIFIYYIPRHVTIRAMKRREDAMMLSSFTAIIVSFWSKLWWVTFRVSSVFQAFVSMGQSGPQKPQEATLPSVVTSSSSFVAHQGWTWRYETNTIIWIILPGHCQHHPHDRRCICHNSHRSNWRGTHRACCHWKNQTKYF